jgi:hypothetical protein
MGTLRKAEKRKDSFTTEGTEITEEKIKDEVEQKIVIATAHAQIYLQPLY